MARSLASIYEEIGVRVLALKELHSLHTLNFAAKSSGSKSGSKNCKKGYPCGKSCINKNRNCAAPLSGQSKTFAAYLAAIGGTTATSSSLTPATPAATPAKKTTKSTKSAKTQAVPAPSSAPTPAPGATTGTAGASPVKTNQSELDKSRADLEQRFGKKTVEAAEKNVQKIMDDADTNIYVRVGSAQTLEAILGDRFKTSAELGIDNHQIPHLKGGYQKARNRVEAKTLGYSEKGTNPEDRPIYGYIGGKDPNGASHRDVSAYGSIAVKLKSDVKDRATFTAADSFKSGIGSEIKNDGTPPPPNAASLVASTRHGYDVTKLPGHYPDYYNDTSIHGSQLKNAAKAKTVDDLATVGAPTGHRYIEAQVHGKVGPKDIAEIAFTPSGISDKPSPAIAQFAKDNGVPLLVNGKKLSNDELDAIITPPADKRSKTLQDLAKALDAGDFDAVVDNALKIDKVASKIKLNPGEKDRSLKALYQESGYDGLPTVATSADIDKIHADGGLLMVRGVSKGTSSNPNKYLKDFQSGDYFTGNGIYGNGTYVGHSGHFTSNGKFVAKNDKTAAKDAKNAVKNVAKHNYIGANTVNLRMAADKDFNVITQSDLLSDRNSLEKKFNNWAKAERQKVVAASSNMPSLTAAQKKQIKQESKDFTQSLDTANVVRKRNGTLAQSHNAKLLKQHPQLRANSMIPNFNEVDDVTIPHTNPKFGKPLNFKLIEADNGFYAIGDDGDLKAVSGKTKTTAIKSAAKIFAESHGYSSVGVNYSPNSKAVADFDQKVQRVRTTLGLEHNSYSNLAVIRGYDAVALDQSYEPTTFMNLLNRSKVVIQDKPLDWNRAKKTGAA